MSATCCCIPGAGSDATIRRCWRSSGRSRRCACVRADFPYRQAGPQGARPAAGAAGGRSATTLDGARREHGEPLVIGGRSMGGRMCSMVAAGADGSPPPAASRARAHLAIRCTRRASPTQLRVEHLPAITRADACSSPAPTTRSGRPTSSQHWTATIRPATVTPRLDRGQGPRPEGLRRDDRGRGQDSVRLRGWRRHWRTDGRSSRVERLELRGGRSRDTTSATTVTTTTWPRATQRHHAAVAASRRRATGPTSSSPTMPPSSAAAVSSPAARPRLPVGNSSAR